MSFDIKDYVIAGLGVLLLVLLGWLHIVRADLKVTEAQFESFKDKTAALGEQAKAHKIEKEANDAKAIQSALGERDAAIKRMRDYIASRSRVPLTPASPGGGDKICFSQKALSAAVERYRAGVRGIIEQGDAAQIDAQTLVNGWPSK